jgi:hypothetical protein
MRPATEARQRPCPEACASLKPGELKAQGVPMSGLLMIFAFIGVFAALNLIDFGRLD